MRPPKLYGSCRTRRVDPVDATLAPRGSECGVCDPLSDALSCIACTGVLRPEQASKGVAARDGRCGGDGSASAPGAGVA